MQYPSGEKGREVDLVEAMEKTSNRTATSSGREEEKVVERTADGRPQHC